jgi:hypothetical protein
MFGVRTLLAQRRLAVLICAAALLLKMLMPAGYMIDDSRGHITVTICSGAAPQSMVMDVSAGQHDMPDHDDSDHGKTQMPCAFSGLSAAALGAIDPILLAVLLAFVMAAGLMGVLLPAPCRPAYLRPPLRGPPLSL